jgi:hypothetical protein
MIYLVHVDPTRQDMLKQCEFLQRSHAEFKNSDKMVILKQDQRSKFKSYGLDDNYPLYNRFISIIEYIKNNKLENEIVCVLDCDMFFRKRLVPRSISKNELVAQKWIYGKINGSWRKDHWKAFDSPEFEMYKSRIKTFDPYKSELILVPFYCYGSTMVELFRNSLNLIKKFRSLFKDWEAELYCLSFTATCLNIKTTYDKLGCGNDEWGGEDYNEYDMIHYGFAVKSKKETLLKKYNMHKTEEFVAELKQIEKEGPLREIDKVMIDFYKKMYGV